MERASCTTLFGNIFYVPGMILYSGSDDRVKCRQMSCEQLMEQQRVSCVASMCVGTKTHRGAVLYCWHVQVAQREGAAYG